MDLLNAYKPVSDTAEAHTLPAQWYVSPELSGLEFREVFRKTWQWVARTEQLTAPGSFVTAQIGTEPVVVVRDNSGELRAFANVCRHRASIISQGEGQCRTLNCPYHGWTYSLEGKLLGARQFDLTKNWDKKDVQLPEYRVSTWGPLVLVCLDAQAPSLADYLGPVPEQVREHGYDLSVFRFALRKEYEIRCNWKVYVDNYQEGYHIPTAHPALFKELDYSKYRVDNFENHSFHFAPLRSEDARSSERRYRDAAIQQTLYYWFFPGLILNLYPDNMSANWVIPMGLDRTRVVFEWFVDEANLAKGPEWIEAMASFSDRVQEEDIRICENVQRGLASSTYEAGRLSPATENGVHFFHRLLHRHLTGGAGGSR